MMMPETTLTAANWLVIADSTYRSRIVAVHVDLTADDARELSRVYRALGYVEDSITITPAPTRIAA
jgi:hypothetical protein